MASKSGGGSTAGINNNNNNIEYWRDYFRTANSDIFDIIEHAIMVAASDCPKEFKMRRERIAEVLFSTRLTRCVGCDRVELAVSKADDDGNEIKVGGLGDDDEFEFDDDDDFGGDGDGGGLSKGSKVNSTSRDGDDHGEGEVGGGGNNINMDVVNQVEEYNPESNYSFGDAEALTDEIEEERELVGEVYRIKDILQNYKDESDSVVFDSLRRLQLMHLNVGILKETEIGKAVNNMRRHCSKKNCKLARELIGGWKVLVDEWMNLKAAQEIAEGGTPDSVNPSTVDEEEGLPSPPLDEGAFAAITQPMELSQIFDGMDDDGNPRNCGEFNKNRGAGRKPSVVKHSAPRWREEPPKEATPQSKDNREPQMRRQEHPPKPNKPANIQSGPGRPLKPNGDLKVPKETRPQQKLEKPMIQRRPAPQPERPRSSNDDSVQEKLEASKRKLQERYQQAENAKRQRTIQVMEIHDIPKQGNVNRNMHGKFGNNNRHWANGRR